MKDIEKRAVRIYQLIRDCSIRTLIEHILDNPVNVADHVFVDDLADADLIISDHSESIESVYSPNKVYGLIDMYDDEGSGRPRNVEILHCTKLVNALTDLVKSVWLLNLSTNVDKYANNQKLAQERLAQRSDYSQDGILKILVVSGTSKSQVSAREDLSRFHLTIATGYEWAMSILKEEQFDVVLTDLGISLEPAGAENGTCKTRKLVPYGVLVMIEAAHRGIKHVAVVTDDNDHDDLSAAVDHFIDPINIDGARAQMIHATMKADGSKDWRKVHETVMFGK